MKTLALALSLFASSTYAGTCAGPAFGPGGCPDSSAPTGPADLCLPDGCTRVSYSWSGDFAVAQSALPNGYPVAGMIGPCLNPDRSQCPDIFNQAFAAMRVNALQANRAQRY